MSENNKYPLVVYTPPAKPKRRSKRTATALLIAVCILGSGAFAFGGTYLANQLNSTNQSETEFEPEMVLTDESGNTVLYQSVIKTTSTSGIAEKMSVEEVVLNTKNTVVEITTETVSRGGFMREYVSTGAGSGVIISQDGYIVTNNHVIENARAITVRLSNGEEYPAELIGTDSKTDLAVIKIDEENLQAAVLGYSADLLVGQTAVAIGNPLGELSGTVTAGIISTLDREITIDGVTMSLLQIDAAVNPGNSGGGLFNLYGELIGVVNAKSSGSEIEGIGFAIPVDTAKIVIKELITHGYVTGRVSAGFELIDIQDSHTAMMYRVNHFGLYIAQSKSDSFQSGDRIVAVDGVEIAGYKDLSDFLSECSVGDVVGVTVVRDGREVTESLTLGEQGRVV